MTDPVKVLSDDELNYLESRSQDTSLDYAEVDEVLRRVPALCATVRALRQQIAELTAEWCQCGHAKTQHGFFSDHDECYECDQMSDDLCCEWRPAPRVTDTYTALREQLAQLQCERDNLYEQNWPFEWQVATAEKKRREEVERQLAQVMETLSHEQPQP